MLNELLKELKNGSDNAFEKIVEIYEQRLLLIAKSRLKDVSLASDAVQETFIELYINSKKIKSCEKLNSWLVVVLINKCNKIMRRSYKPDVSYDLLEEKKPLYQEDLELQKVIGNIDFLNIIDFLSVEERTIITMYFLEEYKIKEIAEVLNLNINTVKSKILRIKEKIEKKLGSEQYE